MSNRKIIAIHPGALGDLILFARLLEKFEGEITLIASGQKAELVAGLGVSKYTYNFDALPMEEVFSGFPAEKSRLTGILGKNDTLISCFCSGNKLAEKRLVEICGAKHAYFIPVRPPAGYKKHLIQYWLENAGFLYERMKYSKKDIPAEWKGHARKLLAENIPGFENNYLVFHPGAGSLEKCWPISNFLSLAGKVRKLKGKNLQALFILGPAEMDRIPKADIEDVSKKFPVISCPSLQELAGLLAGGLAYVGNDSGVSHLSTAVGAPTLALFGPTNPSNFAPLGPKVKILAKQQMAEITVFECLSMLEGFL